MPIDIYSITDKGTVRKSGLSYQPSGPTIVATGGLLVDRSFNSGTSQFLTRLSVFRFRPAPPVGATGHSYTFTVVITGKDDADGRHLLIQVYSDWAGQIDSADYEADELTGDIVADTALSTLSVGSNVVTISGIGSGPYTSFRICISGAEPAGLNALSIASISLNDTYSLSATPGQLAIDGNTANGISIADDEAHRFSWATGQAQTAYELFYRVVGAGSFSSTGVQTTPNQYHDFSSSFFSTDNFEWYVVSYDSESNPSANSAQKTFTVVGSLADPTVSPSGTVTASLLTLSASGAAAHTKEQWQVFEGSTRIYDTGKLTQSSNSHAMQSGYFQNGKDGLEDGHSYTIHYYYFNSSGDIGHGTSSISVVFTPPNEPTIVITAQGSFNNVNYTNPVGGAGVDKNQVLRSVDYDPTNPDDATWELISGDLDPSGSTPAPDDDGIGGPNYRDYEAKHGQLTWYKVRAWSGMAYIDSDPDSATLLRSVWIEIFDPLEPAATLLQLQGWVTGGGNESGMGQSWQPNAVAVSYLNRATPIINRQVTLSGLPVGTTSWSVQVMTAISSTADPETLKDQAEALLRRPTNLVIATKDSPAGRVLRGSVMSLQGPAPVDSLMNRYSFSFTFIESV
jgi:hypothetical protein